MTIDEELRHKAFQELVMTLDCFVDGLVAIYGMSERTRRLAAVLEYAEGDLRRSAERAVAAGMAGEDNWVKKLRWAEKIPTWLAAMDMVRRSYSMWAPRD